MELRGFRIYNVGLVPGVHITIGVVSTHASLFGVFGRRLQIIQMLKKSNCTYSLVNIVCVHVGKISADR